MKLLTRIAALSALLLLSTVSLHAQSAGWANWWFGGGGGVNINMFNGALHDFSATDTGRAAPTGFNDGIGLGPNIHLLLEYNGGGTFGGGLTVGYDSRRVEFDQVTSNVETQTFNENGSVNLSYVSIEPSLRVNIINRFFHLLVGPTLGINVGKSYEYTSTQTSTGATTTATGEVANVRGFVPGYHVGLGYDIPLSGPVASPNVLLAPFAEFHGSTNLLDVPDGNRNDFSVATARVGLRLKFGSPTAVAPPPVSSWHSGH